MLVPSGSDNLTYQGSLVAISSRTIAVDPRSGNLSKSAADQCGHRKITTGRIRLWYSDMALGLRCQVLLSHILQTTD